MVEVDVLVIVVMVLVVAVAGVAMPVVGWGRRGHGLHYKQLWRYTQQQPHAHVPRKNIVFEEYLAWSKKNHELLWLLTCLDLREVVKCEFWLGLSVRPARRPVHGWGGCRCFQGPPAPSCSAPPRHCPGDTRRCPSPAELAAEGWGG